MPQPLDQSVRADQQTVVPAGQDTAVQTNIPIGLASTDVVAANPNRSYLLVTNQGPDECYLTFGAGATVSGLLVRINGWWGTDGLPVVYTGRMTAICAAGKTATLLAIEL